MDYRGLVKRLQVPDGYIVPRELSYHDIRAHAISRADLDEDVRGINASLDIILRTLGMAVAVSIASAIVAFPIAYYMARYTTGKTKAFFYIAVMMPMWASYIVKAYAWTLLLAKGGVAQWFVQHLGLEPLLQLVLLGFLMFGSLLEKIQLRHRVRG